MSEIRVTNAPLAQHSTKRVSSGNSEATDRTSHRTVPERTAAVSERTAATAENVRDSQQQQATERITSREQGAAAAREEVKAAVNRLNEYVQSVQRDLLFQYDEQAQRPVIVVVDKNTQEVIRQIPDDVALKLARNLNQDDSVNLLNIKV